MRTRDADEHMEALNLSTLVWLTDQINPVACVLMVAVVVLAYLLGMTEVRLIALNTFCGG